MTDYSNLSDPELTQAIQETLAAIERLKRTIENISNAAVEGRQPSASVAESLAKLRDHLEDDLVALEEAALEIPRRG